MEPKEHPTEETKIKLSAEELKNLGELAGLEGDSANALAYLERAVIEAVRENQDEELINIIAHIAVIYKHQFHTLAPEDPKRIPYVELMGAHALAGIRIAEQKDITGQPKSAVLLRWGDYFYAKKDYEQAATQYKQALNEMDNYKGEDATQIKAEYQGHYGHALGMAGDPEGLPTLEKSLDSIDTLPESSKRPFELPIIKSGILMRIAEVCLHTGDKEKAIEVLTKAKTIAEELDKEHGMHDRLEQIREVEKILDVTL